MGRLITPLDTQVTQAETTAAPPDDAATRVLKYIPAEVVAFYVAALGIIDTALAPEKVRAGAYIAVFVLGLAAVPLYVWRMATENQPKLLQMIWSAVAFVFWAYTLGGWFKLVPGFHHAWIGSLLLIIVTLIAGLLPVPKQGQL